MTLAGGDMMFYMNHEKMKFNYQKHIGILFFLFLSVVIFFILSDSFIELIIHDCLSSSKELWIFFRLSLFGTCITTTLLIIKNRYLLEKVKKQEKLTQELRFCSEYDSVSSLKNRNCLTRFALEMDKLGVSVSVLLCDIDGLKIINDTLGHMAGDVLIRKAAEILRDTCPKNAEIFRIGGDEFLIVYPEIVSIHDLELLHDSIKKNITNYNSHKEALPLSLSIGFAVSSVDLVSLWEVTKQADYNMYQQKRACKEKVYNNLRNSLIN